MPRARHMTDDDSTPSPATSGSEPATEEQQPERQPEPATATETPSDDDLYEPFPGSEFFHGGRTSGIVAAVGRRLEQEGHAPEGVRLGADWTNAHRRAFAAHQHTLRPKEGGDVSGIPDEVAWKALRVPRVSPR